MSSRYLDLDPYFFAPTRTSKSKYEVNFDKVCDECVELLESFCDIYQNLQRLQIQLNWRLHEISEVMRVADGPDPDHSNNRKDLHNKLTEKEMTTVIEDIDDFRKEFIESGTIEKKCAFSIQLCLLKWKPFLNFTPAFFFCHKVDFTFQFSFCVSYFTAADKMKEMTPWLIVNKDGGKGGETSKPTQAEEEEASTQLKASQEEEEVTKGPQKDTPISGASSLSPRPKQLFRRKLSPKKKSDSKKEEKEEKFKIISSVTEDYDDMFMVVRTTTKRKRSKKKKKSDKEPETKKKRRRHADAT